jgi:hypothetical protein
MFQGVERKFEHNFCIQGIEKATWKKSFVIFAVGEWH